MLVIGIDVGGMSIKAGLVNEKGEILDKAVCETSKIKHYSKVVEDMMCLINTLCSKQNISINDISGIGIGSPGAIDSKNGIVTYAGNLNFKNAPIVEEFAKHTNIPVFLANDADCAALGETKFGSGEGVAYSIMVTLGTGIGTGFIYDNEILKSGYGIGGEGGHIIIKVDGEDCSCGEKGCWETYASATALLRQTKKAMEKDKDSLINDIVKEQGKISGRTAFIAYKKGDKTATKLVNDYVKYIGTGIISLVNIFRPQIVIIGGGVSNEGEYFIKMIEDYVHKHVFGKDFNKVCKIVGASLGNDAGIIGAGTLAMKDNG